MKKMPPAFWKVVVICCFLSVPGTGSALQPPSYENDSFGDIVETIEGSVNAVSADKKTVTVRWLSDPVMMRYENVTLQVVPTTALIKNASPVKFRDIETGDHVTARYDPYASPLAQALSLDIEE
ncbi:MAG: hypothetical protein KTQ49_04290 [Candidatus Omnitrophica bacterium]|nr:hypothetical protein [Candidatus Omnitrophota bacterium]